MDINFSSLIILLFARLSGFFLVSPLFSGKSIPKTIRLGFALACSLLIAPSIMSTELNFTLEKPILLALFVLKEVAVGYLFGFVFSLLFEAAAFAGQLIGTLMGFSATELLDPISSSSHPLLSRFFSLFVFTLFLCLDLHHLLLRLLYESFEAIPLSHFHFTQASAFGILEAVRLFFHLALDFALFPLILLLSLIAIFALVSRFFSIFWIGFPLQLLVGMVAVGASLSYFTPLLKHAFNLFLEIAKKFIVNY